MKTRTKKLQIPRQTETEARENGRAGKKRVSESKTRGKNRAGKVILEKLSEAPDNIARLLSDGKIFGPNNENL